MNILIVCTQLPIPMSDGGRKAVFYTVKHLAERGHKILYMCFVERESPEAVKEMEEFCEVETVPHSRRPTISGAARSVFDSVPYIVSRYHNSELLERMLHRLKERDFDLLHIEGIHAAFYGEKAKESMNIPVTLRVVNLDSVDYRMLKSQKKNPLVKAFLGIEIRKLERYQKDISGKFDKIIMVSENDKKQLLQLNPHAKCEIVPAGVDSSFFKIDRVEERANSVLWLGALGWRPNQDSFWWFYREIVPILVAQVPNVEITVVGSNPPKEILNIRHPNVTVVGQVEDIRPYVQRTDVCVVPLRAGSGMRIKLLEMFAMGKAVVSTTVGCESLGVSHERHLLIADDPNEFANAISRLLSDRDLRERLRNEALKHVQEHFSWPAIMDRYEMILQSLVH